MKTIKQTILLFLLLACSISPSLAADHYFSSSGSASWAASTNISTPCSLATVNANISAGDNAIMLSGTITNAVIHPVNSGTSGSRIVYECEDGGTCTISSNSTTLINLNSGEDYITVKDIAFIVNAVDGSQSLEHMLASGCTGIILDGLTWTISGPQCEKYDSHIDNSSNIEIKNCVFDADADYTGYTMVHASTGAGPDLISFAGSTDVNFHDNIVGTAMHGPLYIEAGSKRIWVHANAFHNRLRHCMNSESHAWWIYGAQEFVLIENNYFESCGDELTSHPIAGERRPAHSIEVNTQRSVIRFNTFDKTNQVISNISANGSPINDVWWYHNTAYDLRTYGTTSGGSGRFIMWTVAYETFQRNHAINNLLYGAQAVQEFYLYDGGTGTGSSLFVNNEVLNNVAIDDDGSLDTRYFSSAYTSIAGLEAAQSQFDNNIQAAPTMIDPANGDFRPDTGSNTEDAGTWLTTISNKSGNQITVGNYDAYAFTAPWSVIGKAGDTVYTNNGDSAVIVSIDAHNLITLDDATNFSIGENLTVVNFNGSAPDIGRYEYGLPPDTTSPTVPSGSPSSAQYCSSDPKPVILSVVCSDNVSCTECKAGTSDVAMASMPITLTESGGLWSGSTGDLSCGSTYRYYGKCKDAANNESAAIQLDFSIGAPASSHASYSGGYAGSPAIHLAAGGNTASLNITGGVEATSSPALLTPVVTSNHAASGTDANITHGWTINEGDLLFAAVHYNNSPGCSDNNGATAFTEYDERTLLSNRRALYWRVAGAAEPSTMHWTLASDQRWSITLFKISPPPGYSVQSPPIDAGGTSPNTGFGGTITASGITVADHSLVIALGYADGTVTFTSFPTGYTEGVTVGADQAMSSYYLLDVSAATLGSQTFAFTPNKDWGGELISFLPAN